VKYLKNSNPSSLCKCSNDKDESDSWSKDKFLIDQTNQPVTI